MDELSARRRRHGAAHHPTRIMDEVYRAGSLAVAPDDVLTRIVVRQLHRFGLLEVDALSPEGPRRLDRAGEDAARLPWRVSRPGLAGRRGHRRRLRAD